jgi:hypothetical protein
MKILFLSANPRETSTLDLAKEVRKIEDGLQRSKLRDQFQLVSKWAVDSNSLRRALLDENPDIVHFSGHGEGQAGLVLVGQDGKSKPATAEALSGLLKQFPNIKCVLLNACYAEVQAKAIVQHIDYVIGMKQAVRDDAAIAFATGFYDGLGYGKPIDFAFSLGCNAIQFELASFSSTTRSRKAIPVDFENIAALEPLSDHLIPVLLKKETGSTGSLMSSHPSSSESNSLSEILQLKDNSSREDTLKIYRKRVQEFLADLNLTQIEKFQLAILANVLGVSATDANRIVQEEQKRLENNAQSTVTNGKLFSTKIGNAKIYLFVCGVALLFGLAGFVIYKQTTLIDPKYAQLKTLLEEKDWKNADEETARLMWELADRQQEQSLRTEDWDKFRCSYLREMNALWEKYSQKQYGFAVQKHIWLSNNVNEDLGKFVDSVGWGGIQENNSFVYWHMYSEAFNFDSSNSRPGNLPWKVTYWGGNNETRISYLKRLESCGL